MADFPDTPVRDAALWRQVADLRPRLRHGVEILVQDYRGERWYLLHDKASGRFLRFNTVAYEFLGRLDGDLSVQDIIVLANADAGALRVLTPEDALQVLAQLHAAEVLRGGLPLGAQDVLERYQQSQRYRRRRALSNPLALRISLFDPDRLLAMLLPAVRWAFSWSGFLVWTLMVVTASLLALVNAAELSAAVADKTLSAGEVLTFWLLYPAVKALHELGHGLAVKVWGGEVHETGISLLVFMPVPYVDASASWALRDKRRRAIVGAAGIMVELLLAALATFVWLIVEPGVVRDMALNVMLIGGVSTLFFNGNPLVRFDGYYVLEDLVEIPSLASRSSRYYQYLIKRYLLGIDGARSPVTAKGEKAWFTAYGLLSPLYRLSVTIGIALYLAGTFLIVGIVLAAWAVFMQIMRPLVLSIRFIATSPHLEARRIRGVALVAGVVLVVVAVLSLPAPSITRVQGVVWPAANARVVNGVGGFVTDVVAPSGSRVASGDVLLRLDDPELRARRTVLTARLKELRNAYAAQRAISRVRAAMVADDMTAVQAELAHAQSQLDQLTVRAGATGRFYVADPRGLDGRWLRQGDLIGYVMTSDAPLVRAVVGQDQIGLLRSRETRASVVLPDRIGDQVPAFIAREVPAGSSDLPSAALGALAGGEVAIDARDPEGRTAAEKVFQLELALPAGTPVAGVGERVHVRLDHGREPLWQQWSRGLRQLVLSRLQT
ncbi:MAG: peptidase M50 [Gammaproteobacteria bacterium]|nr:peptidase M50 [Gammaproteobacteria bacterium]